MSSIPDERITISAEACCRCRFWCPAGTVVTGECVRYPPTKGFGVWPKTTYAEWCGEFSCGPYAAKTVDRMMEFWIELGLDHPECP